MWNLKNYNKLVSKAKRSRNLEFMFRSFMTLLSFISSFSLPSTKNQIRRKT